MLEDFRIDGNDDVPPAVDVLSRRSDAREVADRSSFC
jgi:hypothetical protein